MLSIVGCGFNTKVSETLPIRIYPHQRCGGQLVYTGKSYTVLSEQGINSYVHKCTLCSNEVELINQTWPKSEK